MRWALLVFAVLVLILVPFILFEKQIEGWTSQFLLSAGKGNHYTGLVIGLLLASDVFLPIPSSILSTGAGFLLGFTQGTLVTFSGMTLGCMVAYGFGKSSRDAINRIPQNNLADIERFFNRYGSWAVVLARPIPVLAEASVIFAGISRMHFGQYMLGTSLSNLGISIMYAAVGSYSISVNSFLLALLGAISLPAIAWLFMYLLEKKKEALP